VIRSGNPALKGEVFTRHGAIGVSSDTMTIQGTANKAFILLAFCTLTAFYAWREFFAGNVGLVQPMMMGGAIGGMVIALVTIFKKTWAPVTAPLYALAEGLFIGGVSAMFELRYPGIVIQAVGLTLCVFAALLFAYKSRMIQATENFKLGLVAATGGIFLIYLVSWIMSFFGTQIPFIHESGIIGIGFSLVVCVVAALNLVMDFDFIENGEAARAPKYMEWYGAFGLLVTLVWLYIELLRLLSKLNKK
jgi:uncharacterized YccA/Bax inhibitor family protein